MTRKLLTSAAAFAIAVVGATGVAAAREQIRIVGSSTVFPFTQAVSEQFSKESGKPSPVVESTGTGGGMKIFCGGVGEEHPDITGASRAMKESEWKLCKENGVTEVSEALIGFDGITVAVSRDGAELDLSKKQLFQALAAEVEVDGEVKANPYKKWSEIDASLPDIAITVFGPPPTSGTRDAWVELVMEEACGEFPAIEKLEKDRKKEVCQRMRQDGPFIEAGENDNLIVQRLQQDKNALGIFGYSFLAENEDTLKAVKVEGVAPSPETIADESYKVSRPLFFYVKNAHRKVVPGLEEFVAAYMSEEAIGPDGYLSERGLIPLPDDQRKEVQDAVTGAKSFTRYGS